MISGSAFRDGRDYRYDSQGAIEKEPPPFFHHGRGGILARRGVVDLSTSLIWRQLFGTETTMRVFELILLATLWTASASAKDVAVGPVTITLTTPGGACAADESNPVDKKLIANIKGMIASAGTTLLAEYGDCQQFIDWRASKLPTIPLQWQYQSMDFYEKDGIKDTAANILKKNCADLRSQGDKFAETDLPKLRAHAKIYLKKVEVNGSVFMGVVDETPEACYAALLQQFKSSSGIPIKQIALWATVVVKNRVIFYYHYAPYTDADSIVKVLADFKPQVAAFLSANK